MLSKELLAQHAAARRYFFHVDLHGRLFSADTIVRNLATCVKGERPLDFFFAQLRPNTTGLFEREYPFVSPCGKELSYVAAEDTPIVFSELFLGASDAAAQLAYAGSARQPFEPARLLLSASSGRLYHPLATHARLAGLPGATSQYMLLRSHLVSELQRCMVPSVDAAESSSAPPLEVGAGATPSGVDFEWEDRRYPIWSAR
ncbi:hypothetical protein T492DRAFT_984105 [Pavlovales sp. CCMP2436]|nr:hypothetical protein T492DRAFT_984105 [Pavlovales sp. CCMP2436]|mmetsp:Transcript_22189/g.56235  ORF Transcript_22189/g.56235 Transcript_22189/m.56235 type:complete len:202 (-) Transcript_22189:54-659(-)